MAAFDSYASLQTTALSWANRQGDTDLVSRIPDLIDVIEPEIDSKLRRTTAQATLTASANPTPLPSDCKELRSIQVASANPSQANVIAIVSPSMLGDLGQLQSSTGVPEAAYIQGGNLYLWPAPQTATSLTVSYFTKLVPLSNTAPSNAVLANYPNIYLFGILKEMAPYLEQPDENALWQQKFESAIMDANIDREREEYSASVRPLRLPVAFS
jgi:hypothetical protein